MTAIMLLGAGIAVLVSQTTVASGDGLARTSQTGAPSVLVSYATPSVIHPVRINSPVPVAATFSEPVSGFAVEDISLVNGLASHFVGSDGDAVYNFDVTPNAIGVVTVDIAAGVAEDVGQNGNTAAPQFLLGIPYDDDRNSVMSRDEVITAITDYLFSGLITRDETLAVIVLYLFPPTPTPTPTPKPTPTPPPPPPYVKEFLFGDDVPPQKEADIRQAVHLMHEYALSLGMRESDIERDLAIYVYYHDIDKFVSIYQDIFGGSRSNAIEDLIDSSAFSRGGRYIFMNLTGRSHQTRWRVMRTPAHELHHAHTSNLSSLSKGGPDDEVPPAGPEWLNEGGAHYLAWRALSWGEVVPYDFARLDVVSEAL